MTKTAIIGGKEYRMRASALTPRLYRAFFKRDIIRDMQGLITVYNKVVEVQKKEDATEEEQNAVSMELLDHLEVFENTAWLFCKEAGEVVGDSPEEWLDSIEGVFVAVCDHPLKLSAVVVGAALRSVDVLAYDGIAVVCGEFVAGLELTFNRLLALAVA